MNSKVIVDVETNEAKLEECQNPLTSQWEELECELHGTTMAFNSKGSFLALGDIDGRVGLWDYTTVPVLTCVLDPSEFIITTPVSSKGRHRNSPRKSIGSQSPTSPTPTSPKGRRSPRRVTSPTGVHSWENAQTDPNSPTEHRRHHHNTPLAVNEFISLLPEGWLQTAANVERLKKVVSCYWSGDSRWLAVGYAARSTQARLSYGYICIWDVASRKVRSTFRVQAVISCLRIHPKDRNILVICCESKDPVVLNLQTHTCRTIKAGIPKETVKPTEDDTAAEPSSSSRRNTKDATADVQFDKEGQRMYVRSSRGWIFVVEYPSLEIVHKEEIASAASQIFPMVRLSHDGSFLVLTSNRGIRKLSLDPERLLEEERLFAIGTVKAPWACCRISHDDKRLLGVASSKYRHHPGIYVWEDYKKDDEAFVPIIKEEIKDGIVEIEWHPTKPIILAISNVGELYLMETKYKSDWPGPMFPTGYTLVDDNTYYVEREDEFDIVADEEPKKVIIDEDIEVDVESISEGDEFVNEDELTSLPVIITSTGPTAEELNAAHDMRPLFDIFSILPQKRARVED